MTPFKLSEELLEQVISDIAYENDKALQTLFKEYHYADLAEIFDNLQIQEFALDFQWF